jgi:hypothetical protein
MSEYQKAENFGRKKFIDWCEGNQQIRITEVSDDPSSPWDIKMYSGNTFFIVELKDRKCPSSKYDNYVLEKKKYDNLKSTFPANNILYINTFEDNKVLIWNITNLQNQKVHKKIMNKTTATITKKEEKEIYYLHSKYSI